MNTSIAALLGWLLPILIEEEKDEIGHRGEGQTVGELSET